MRSPALEGTRDNPRMHPARGSILAATLVVALQMPATARAGDKAAVAPAPFLTPEFVSLLDLPGRSVVEYEQRSVGLAGDAEAPLWTRMADSRLGPAAAGLHVGE